MTDLEAVVDQLVDRVESLESELQEERRARIDAEQRVAELEDELNQVDKKVDAAFNKAKTTRDMVAELQSRELEKSAHLRWENVEPQHYDDRLDVAGDRFEKFEKDDGTYCRLPGSDDPLNRGGSTRLSHSDLLPIQQLAQMDDEMLYSTAKSRPARLAAEAWQARQDDSVDLWSEGCNGVRQYLDAGDLAVWIRVNETGVDKAYSQKLAKRTIEAIEDLAKGRLYSKMKNRRKDGLSYKERRLILTDEADIPGESPQTDGVDGEACQ